MVIQADEYHIPIIEEILLDAVNWMSKSGLQNQWNESIGLIYQSPIK